MAAEDGREASLAIARRQRDGSISVNDAVDELGVFSALSFVDRTGLLLELLDDLALEDIPSAVSS